MKYYFPARTKMLLAQSSKAVKQHAPQGVSTWKWTETIPKRFVQTPRLVHETHFKLVSQLIVKKDAIHFAAKSKIYIYIYHE